MLPQWTILGIALLIAGMYLLVDGYLSVKSIKQDQLRLMAHFSDDIDARLSQRLSSASEALQNIDMTLAKFGDRTGGPKTTNASLTLIANSLTGVRAINIVSKEGDVLATSGIEFVGQNFANSERFRRIAAGTDPYATYVAPVFKTPVGLSTTSIARQIIGVDGKFDGYVMAVLDPLYFRTLLRSALYDRDVDVSLLDASGEYLLTASVPGGSLYKHVSDNSTAFEHYFKQGDYD